MGEVFGYGLVRTSENFGAQSEFPTHPELLDWLATKFVSLNWDMKAMQKLVVMSSVYQQSSNLNPTLLNIDPENRLLARGSRLRLSGETLRDQALSASGLLVHKTGGLRFALICLKAFGMKQAVMVILEITKMTKAKPFTEGLCTLFGKGQQLLQRCFF